MTLDAENPDYDEQLHAENAIAAIEVARQETYDELFDLILKTCVRHGQHIGEARLSTRMALGMITGALPPENFGLPAETTDLF